MRYKLSVFGAFWAIILGLEYIVSGSLSLSFWLAEPHSSGFRHVPAAQVKRPHDPPVFAVP